MIYIFFIHKINNYEYITTFYLKVKMFYVVGYVKHFW